MKTKPETVWDAIDRANAERAMLAEAWRAYYAGETNIRPAK